MAVHGFVNAPEKLLGGLAGNILGDSDRDVHFNNQLLSVDGNGIRTIHPLRDLLGPHHSRIQAAVQNHGEFIASPAADEVAGSDLAAEARTQLLEYFVAVEMAEPVIEALQRIQIEEQHAKLTLGFDARG